MPFGTKAEKETRMLEVQKYLTSGKTLENLADELAIKVTKHDALPLIILNYDQINSPKTHPIIRETRGLVLNSQDWSIVAKSMNRFFNWGEVQEEMSSFDFSNFIVQSKEDGSLVLIYNFDGSWRVNTRGSFATDLMQFQNFTWQEGICRALGVPDLLALDSILDPTVTYVCEFCSLWNKVVRTYKEPQMFLLTAFRGITELHWDELDSLDLSLFQVPELYEFHSIEEIQQFLFDQGSNDPTFEGVVIRDHHGHRWKIKSATYLGLHRLRGEGDNVWNPKHLLPFVLNGEEDELLSYFEEVRTFFYELKSDVQAEYMKLLETWLDHKDIPEQKDFALAIKNKTRFTSVLFTVRKKYGSGATSMNFKTEWRNAEAAILKIVKI